jgi:rubredoxin
MALVAAFDDLKANRIRRVSDKPGTTGGLLYTPMLGARDKPDLPHAALAQFDPGRISRPHFHLRDQFQVVVGGKGSLGRHEIYPYTVHFSRAYTPYGPLVSGAGTGLTFFVMRAHPDPGSQRLPQELDKLKQATDRQPWQIHRPAVFPTLQSGASTADTVLQAIPDVKDERGLAAYTLSMKPDAKAHAPDPSHGDGQYLIVVKGSLLHQNTEHKALAVVFVRPDESAFPLHAGPEGLEGIVLNYPTPHVRANDAASSARGTTGLKIWKCALCEFVYDEAAGLPQEGLAAGTRWQDVPDTWSCPDCGAYKTDFHMIELVN